MYILKTSWKKKDVSAIFETVEKKMQVQSKISYFCSGRAIYAKTAF